MLGGTGLKSNAKAKATGTREYGKILKYAE